MLYEELYTKVQTKRNLLQEVFFTCVVSQIKLDWIGLEEVILRKLQLFGHICRMNDSRTIKWLVFGIMDRK